MNLLSSVIILALASTSAVSAESIRGASALSHHQHQSNKCYNLYSDMAYNSLMQKYANNPDDRAKGYASCKLCTDGTMTCDANVYGGVTQLIASHIHLADNGDGNTGSGAPVINFCGSNDRGMITDPGTYMDACKMYSDNGNSVNNDMTGNKSMGVDQSIYDLVNDVGNYPEKYYLNFHSIASWSYWLSHGGKPVGMCRGVVKSNYADLEEERD